MYQLAVACSAGDARYDCLDGWGVCREQEKLFLFIPACVAVLNYVNCKVYSLMQRSP
jgi:hypothetical protein